jgi:hypothetical protein
MADTFDALADKLIENESAIGALYDLFAATFPVDRDLWAGLAREEEQHAAWIRQAVENLPSETRQRPVPLIHLQAVVSLLTYATALAERCRRGELTRFTALALARDLENSLLEGKVLTTLATSLSHLEKALVESTTAHRERIAAAWQALRG